METPKNSEILAPEEEARRFEIENAIVRGVAAKVGDSYHKICVEAAAKVAETDC